MERKCVENKSGEEALDNNKWEFLADSVSSCFGANFNMLPYVVIPHALPEF